MLRNAKEMGGDEVVTKSGLMVGLGETQEEMVETFGMLREHGVAGAHGRPVPAARPSDHLPVVRYWHPDEFADARARGVRDGLRVTWRPGPLVRSSYHADADVSQQGPARAR